MWPESKWNPTKQRQHNTTSRSGLALEFFKVKYTLFLWMHSIQPLTESPHTTFDCSGKPRKTIRSQVDYRCRQESNKSSRGNSLFFTRITEFFRLRFRPTFCMYPPVSHLFSVCGWLNGPSHKITSKKKKEKHPKKRDSCSGIWIRNKSRGGRELNIHL